jgi:flavodoxin
MKALVTYYSQGGNTEKLARAIYEAIPVEKEIIPLRDIETLEGYDIIFCGFPVHAHGVPGKVQPFFRKFSPGQKVAFFSTHGSLRGGPFPRQAFEHALSLANSARIIGTFGSRGAVDAKLLEAIRKQQEHQAWAEEAQSAEGHPDAADLADGRAFALEMIKKVRESA